MFTGIVEEIGIVLEAGARLSVACIQVMEDMTVGASIAVNGVCLTAVDIRSDGFSADLAPETLDRSNLGDLMPGHLVNLERPITLAARLSGHIMQGHVDGTATLKKLRPLGDENWELLVEIPEALDRYLVYKGSIAIDGISLTVADVTDRIVRAAIIPHTYDATNLSTRKPGDRLNIECDILAKHVEKLVARLSL